VRRLGEDGVDQQGDGVVSAGWPLAAVRAAGIGGHVVADQGQEAVNGIWSGSMPAVAAARAAIVAVMLCTSSSAQVSCRARAGERPRRTRPAPLTVFFR